MTNESRSGPTPQQGEHGTTFRRDGKAQSDIVERTAAFADRVIRLSFHLPGNPAGWEIGKQVVRAAMSVGANVEESQGAESKRDFVHKMRIARKECREAKYFLVRIANADLIPSERLSDIIDEADQLRRILTTIILNSGGRQPAPQARNRAHGVRNP